MCGHRKTTNPVTVMVGPTKTSFAATTTATASAGPFALAVNAVTNQIYVANRDDNQVKDSLAVIDGATNTVNTFNTTPATGPGGKAVNPLTNRIQLAHETTNNLAVFDCA